MRVLLRTLLAAGAAVALGSAANATTLTGGFNVDNSFSAYISTNDSVLGTLLVTGADWPSTYSFSTNLAAGQTYYLHVDASNFEGSTDVHGGWDGFLGSFHLSDANFHFANGLQDLNTDTANWRAAGQPLTGSDSSQQSGSPWIAPVGSPIDHGQNGSYPWGQRYGVSPDAHWIWSQTDPSGEAFFSTTITAAVPEPASWALMIGGFGLMGATLRRRRAAVAAA